MTHFKQKPRGLSEHGFRDRGSVLLSLSWTSFSVLEVVLASPCTRWKRARDFHQENVSETGSGRPGQAMATRSCTVAASHLPLRSPLPGGVSGRMTLITFLSREGLRGTCPPLSGPARPCLSTCGTPKQTNRLLLWVANQKPSGKMGRFLKCLRAWTF